MNEQLDIEKEIAELVSKRKHKTGTQSENQEERLNLLASEIRLRIKRTKQDIFTIGELLVEAKILLSGKFQQWIEDTFDFGYHTANNLMNVYVNLKDNRDLIEKIPTSILYKIAANSFPDDLRQFLLSNKILDDMPNREFDGIVDVHKDEGFEAVKKKFEFMDKKKRIYNQVSYNLNQIKAAVKSLESIQAKIEKHGQGYNDFGEEPQADEINWKIVDTINESIKQLNQTWVDSTQKLKAIEYKDLEELEGTTRPEKLGPLVETFKRRVLANARKQISGKPDYNEEDEMKDGAAAYAESRLIFAERNIDLETPDFNK